MNPPVDVTKPIDLLDTPAAVENLKIGEAAGLKMNKKTDKRAKRLLALIIAGVIWSFVYAGITLFIMVSVINQTNEVCVSLQQSRETVREILIGIEELDFTTDELVAALPPVEC